MSIKITEQILRNFLTSSTPQVLALTGDWGTGKTHTWHAAVEAHEDAISFENYSYVSLFGISSISDLRTSILLQTTQINTDRKTSNDQQNPRATAINYVTSTAPWAWIKSKISVISKLANLTQYGGLVTFGIETLAQNAIRNTLICFDDFERLSDSVNTDEVLGLINELKENRACKVVVIFNSKELDSSDTYRKYREKVFDLEIKFKPEVTEAFDLIFEPTFKHRDKIQSHVEDLQISNIRILRKLRAQIDLLFMELHDQHEAVLFSMISTTVLLVWCTYTNDPSKPNLTQIAEWNSKLLSFTKPSDDDPDPPWVNRLRSYGLLGVNELDLAIAKVIENGYVEGSGLIEIATTQSNQQKHAAKKEQFKKAWDRFYNSFSYDTNEFITELHSAAQEAIGNISSGDLDATVRLLRELDQASNDDELTEHIQANDAKHNEDDGHRPAQSNANQLADQLIEEYIKIHKNKPRVFNLDDDPFGGSITDDSLREKFQLAYSQLAQLPSLKDALTFVAKNQGANLEHLTAMNNASVDDYETVFLDEDSEVPMSQLVKVALQQYGEPYTDSSDNAKKALERIKETSKLNAIRVRRFGI